MKQYKYLYARMLDEEIIRKAYKKLRKGKTKRLEIQLIDANLDNEVRAMREMILNTKPEGVSVEYPELAFKPRKRKPTIVLEHGKERKIYKPDIYEQWLHHIIVQILEPIVMATAYPYACGSFPRRGAHYGKKQIVRWLKDGKGIRNFAKCDIRHFYDSIRLDILMRELGIRIKDEWFLYIIKVCLTGFNKGIPLGFYISQWLANYLLEPLDKFITEKLGIKKHIRYMDDMVLYDNAKKNLHRAISLIRQFIGKRFRLKLKHNYQVCRFYYEGKTKTVGRCLDFMGFKFYPHKTILRKNVMLNATRLAARMYGAKQSGKPYYNRHIRGMLSYMGWFTHSDTYGCYENRIKPYINIRNLKTIISKLDRREKDEKLVKGNLCYAA